MISAANNLEMALAYAAAGYHVFPIKPGTKEPDGRLAQRGHLDATTDPTKIKDWWGLMPRLGIGINCEESGVVAVDIDPRLGGGLQRIDPVDRSTQSDGVESAYECDAGVGATLIAGPPVQIPWDCADQ